MKIFFYKTILVALVFFITFKLTLGSLINQTKSQVKDLTSKEKDTKRFSTVMNDLSDKTLKGTMKKIDKFLLNENL